MLFKVFDSFLTGPFVLLILTFIRKEPTQNTEKFFVLFIDYFYSYVESILPY